jgi:hypothetical protein
MALFGDRYKPVNPESPVLIWAKEKCAEVMEETRWAECEQAISLELARQTRPDGGRVDLGGLKLDRIPWALKYRKHCAPYGLPTKHGAHSVFCSL